MSEPRYISPMLDGFSLGQSISDHSGVECYPAMRDDSEKRYIVKRISLPASQVQVEALLLTGVYRDAESVSAYYKDLAEGVREEVRTLEKLAGLRGFVPYQDCQIEPMENAVGYEVHLLSRYRMTLDRFTRRNPMTHLGALNLGIDLCAALAVCREAGWLYVDLKPENIYLFNDQEYRIGDLGFISMDSLEYASLPDRYRSVYTAPEVADAYASLNATMDTYALGLVLYQIYNGGILPFADAQERSAWLSKLAGGEAVAAPVCADEEMAAIITKACAYDPADRWQTPAELGHALINYMQRNGAENIPIELPAEPEPDPEPEIVEETPAKSAETPTEVEDVAAESIENADLVEDAISEEAPAESVVEEEPSKDPDNSAETEQIPSDSALTDSEVEQEEVPDPETEPEADWIDLMDAFLAEENDPAAEEDDMSLRQILEDESEYLCNAQEITEDDVTADTADILTFANELIEHEAPAPVVVPEPIDIPIPEPIPVELPEEELPADEDEDAQIEEEISIALADEDTEVQPVIQEPKKSSGLWKKILRTAAALALTAALAFGVWYYYQNFYLQTIDAMSCEGTGTQVTITVDTAMDQSKLTVICKDTYGNAVDAKLSGGVVTFTDLVPGSQYIITLEPDGFNKLLGTTSVTYSTPAETKLINLTAVTGQEPGCAIISFGVEGLDSAMWTAVCTAEGEEQRTMTFEGHTVTITGLTVGTEYTFTITPEEEVLLVGENVITHTASDLVQAQNLTLADYADGALTITWTAPEGTAVDRWIARCYNSDGYDQLLEVTEPKATFADITDGAVYIVEVTAANMTLGVRTEITADANNITGFGAALNGSSIELNWNYGGPTPEEGWKILWSADGGSEQILTAAENHAVLSPAAPGSTYTFTIQPPAGSSIQASTTVLSVPDAGSFAANKLDSESIIVEMFDVPSRNDWGYGTLQRSREQDTFQPGSSLALLYTVTKPYDFDSNAFETIFVIRDSDGKLVSAASRIRVWDDMWDNGYCTETVSNLPADPGSYTLTILIANGVLVHLPFSIV